MRIQARALPLTLPRCSLPALLRTRTAFALAALAAGSCIATCVLGLRWVAIGQLGHTYLVWNLMLAWIPVPLALLVAQRALWRPVRALAALAWILFLPNAFYIVTDFVHLHERPPVPLWLDALLLQMFAFTGLLLGFVSLYVVQAPLTRRFGELGGWCAALAVLALCGLGVYIGRFLRWNSWDLFLDPVDFARQLAELVRHPLRDRTAFVAPLAFGGFYALCYVTLYALAGLRRRLA